MKLISIGAIVALCLAAWAGPLNAQTDTAPPALTSATRAAIIDSAMSYFRTYYVYPERVDGFEQSIRDRRSAGEYDDITTLDRFCEQLTDDLQKVSSDRHARVDIIDPDHIWLPEGDTATEKQIAGVARENFGFRTVKWLPGNVGYIDVHLFPPLEYSGRKAVDAMGFLADCDAVIFDCRNHHGGDDRMLCFVASYFFKEVTLLHTFYHTFADSSEQVWTQAFVPGRPLYDKKLYILTSRATGSGGEAFPTR